MLDRRDLLKLSAIGGAAALVPGCMPPKAEESAISGGVGSGGDAGERRETIGGVRTFELEEWTVDQLQEAMGEGRLAAQDIVQTYLDRIEEIDHSGPELRSVLALNPDALRIAGELDSERSAGYLRGPLHGIPVLLKDNIDTADGMATTAGSLALAGTIALEDSTVAKNLRDAGAVILGKANLSEWANFRSERSSSGWSGVGGQTKNPYALDRNPCGSSSGSGVAVSANLAALAIGTETDGSVVCPSNANGIVGVKPTVGRVSRAGIVPISESQDTAGPMARTVRDAALLLNAMASVDSRDPATAAAGGPVDFSAVLDEGALNGARIGVWRDRFGFHEKVDAILEESLTALREGGAELIDPIEMPSVGEVGDYEYDVLLYEFKDCLAKYLAGRGNDTAVRSLADVIEFNLANRDREMPYFEQEVFDKAEAKGPLTDAAYLEARTKCHELTRKEGIDRVVSKHRLDAIIGPTGGPAWVTDLVNGDHFGGGSSLAAAVSGYPAVTVPAGFVHGLPVGLTFFGPAWSEAALLALAYAFEQATRVRRPPRLLPTAKL
ncbi:MAG: amidase [bacterium]|nr:amidase [bacterium]